ncbi:MAG: hypothetical protein NDJ92_06880 [Thermoanaerobaculia bacterium]|nr:hypothetical protein [Thermoanaerobaculia bacterium]
MALQDAVRKLARTGRGRVVLAVLGIWALVVLGDSVGRLVGVGPYQRNWSGEVVSKHQSTLGWVTHVAAGRAIFSATDKGTRGAPVGPWRLVVKRAGGSTIEVAVPRRVWERAAPGMIVKGVRPAAAAIVSD